MNPEWQDGRIETRCLSMREFREKLKNPKTLVVRFEGPVMESYFTKNKYVHYETVASWGGENDDASWRILYHTDGEFTIRGGGQALKASHPNIRTRLAPAFRKVIRKGDGGALAAEGSALADVFAGGVERVVLTEYGIEAGRDYHAAFTVESYHLPPAGPGGKPQRRENVVLTVSAAPLPNETPLTPLYRHWSY